MKHPPSTGIPTGKGCRLFRPMAFIVAMISSSVSIPSRVPPPGSLFLIRLTSSSAMCWSCTGEDDGEEWDDGRKEGGRDGGRKGGREGGKEIVGQGGTWL